MSSKSHIIYDKGIECFHETNESFEDILGNYLGFNIYLVIDDYQYSFTVEKGIMRLKTESEILGEININMRDVFEFDVDKDGLLLGIRGGSVTGEMLKSFKDIP